MTETIESMTMESASLKTELNDSKHLVNRLKEKITELETQLGYKDEELTTANDTIDGFESMIKEAGVIDEINSPDDYNRIHRIDKMASLSAKLVEVQDIVADSDSSDYVLAMHLPSDEETYIYDMCGNIYVIDEIGGIPINDLTFIKTEALNALKERAEDTEKKG